MVICKEKQLHTVGAFAGEKHLVAVFELLLAAHAQALRGDFFEVAIPREEEVHGVVRHLLVRLGGLGGGDLVENLAAAGLAVFLRYIA